MNIDIPENERLDTQNDALEEVYNSLLKWQFLVCILDFWSVKFFRGHFQLPWFRSLNQTGEIDRVTEFFSHLRLVATQGRHLEFPVVSSLVTHTPTMEQALQKMQK